MNYLESEPEFFAYLTEIENITINSRTNYISWLRFLSQHHKIDETLTEEFISSILNLEDSSRLLRNFYTKEKDLSNFKSALNKYLKYLKSNYGDEIFLNSEKEVISINKRNDITITEKQNLALSRIGQGKFRKSLIEYWKGCSITKIDKINLLVASHIKPWRISDNIERLDVYNGLLLLPNYDKLFDKGYIMFDEKGKIKISKYLNQNDLNLLNINSDVVLNNIEIKHKEYLHFHAENCFIR